jgi:hypothetical protein
MNPFLLQYFISVKEKVNYTEIQDERHLLPSSLLKAATQSWPIPTATVLKKDKTMHAHAHTV